jgi:hypothetical protein
MFYVARVRKGLNIYSRRNIFNKPGQKKAASPLPSCIIKNKEILYFPSCTVAYILHE